MQNRRKFDYLINIEGKKKPNSWNKTIYRWFGIFLKTVNSANPTFSFILILIYIYIYIYFFFDVMILIYIVH